MELETLTCSQGSAVSVTLDVITHGDPNVDACIEQYALLRITWLADATGMSLEGPVERSAY